MAMHRGEAEPYPLSPLDNAAELRRRRPNWRRAVAAAVAAAFALMAVSLGFHRYAHHVALGSSHPLRFLTPN